MSEQTATTTNKPDLLDCDSLMLSSYLLHHRFEGDAVATASFLLEATSALPNAEAISAQFMGETDEKQPAKEEKSAAAAAAAAVVVDTSDLGNTLSDQHTISMTTPRGKFQMTLYEQGIRCINAKNQTLIVSPQAVERIVMFPKPEDCRATSKPSGGDMVLLCLHKETFTQFNDKTLTQVCFQLPKESPVKDDSSITWLHLLCSSLSNKQVAMVQNPKSPLGNRSRYAFKSHDEGNTSSTTAGMPYVQCYYGVKDGVLYPMQEGLLFFKYVLFVVCVCRCYCRVSHARSHILDFVIVII